MSQLSQDFRFSLRMLRKSPGLITVVALSLGIGIGANTAAFSVANALFLRPLPYPHPDRLAILWLRSPGIGIPQDWPSPGEYIDIVNQNHVFDQTAIAIGDTRVMTGLALPEKVETVQTSSSLFPMLGATAQLGRIILPDEDIPGRPKVAVLSDGFWKRFYGADPKIIGRALTLNGEQYTVVGVLRPGFLLNREVMPTVGGIEKADILMPLPLGADAVNRRGDENFNILARVKPGVSMRQAQSDIDVIAARIRQKDRRDRTFTISVVPLLEQVVGNIRQTVLVLLGAVSLVLLIACANVANLLLSRAITRHKEIAVRAALGAGRGRLIQQCLAESVTLGLVGGVAGLVFAAITLYAVRELDPGNIPRLDQIGIDGRTLAFTFGISLFTGVLFGLVPAFRVAATDLNTALKAGGRSSQSGGGLDISRHRLRSLLVISEVALSLMLLVGAGLLVRSFVRLEHVPPGFNAEHVLSLQMSLSGPRYRNNEQAVANAYQQIEARIAKLPGIQSVGSIQALPLTSSVSWGGMVVEGYVPPPGEPEIQYDVRGATPNYFQTMEIPLLRGRYFTASDLPGGEKVVLIDEKMANRFWSNQDPIGKRVRFSGSAENEWRKIVGVVGTVKQYGLDVDLRMVVYFPHTQFIVYSMYAVARTATDGRSISSAIIREIHAVDPGVPVYDVQTMQQRLRHSLARQRFTMLTIEAFSLFALMLSIVGVYGVVSYQVEQATREIGVRVALGAGRSDVLRLVLSQGLKLIGAGILLGLMGAFVFSRVMESLLFGVSATDAATFAMVVLILSVVALAASLVPAMRAARISPMAALRYE